MQRSRAVVEWELSMVEKMRNKLETLDEKLALKGKALEMRDTNRAEGWIAVDKKVPYGAVA